MKLFVLEDYHVCTKLFYSTLLTKVSNGLYGTPNIGVFPSPTIPKTAFLLLVSTYRTATLEHEAGGVDEKPAYDAALTAMTAALDSGKAYVEGLPALTYDLINTSGYTPNKQSVSSSVVPDPPLLRAITRAAGGTTMTFEYDAVDGAEFYGTYIVEGDTWPAGYTFINGILDYPKTANVRLMHNGLKQRNKTYHNLTIGQQYTIFSYAGNTAGVSTMSAGRTFTASES